MMGDKIYHLHPAEAVSQLDFRPVTSDDVTLGFKLGQWVLRTQTHAHTPQCVQIKCIKVMIASVLCE